MYSHLFSCSALNKVSWLLYNQCDLLLHSWIKSHEPENTQLRQQAQIIGNRGVLNSLKRANDELQVGVSVVNPSWTSALQGHVAFQETTYPGWVADTLALFPFQSRNHAIIPDMSQQFHKQSSLTTTSHHISLHPALRTTLDSFKSGHPPLVPPLSYSQPCSRSTCHNPRSHHRSARSISAHPELKPEFLLVCQSTAHITSHSFSFWTLKCPLSSPIFPLL